MWYVECFHHQTNLLFLTLSRKKWIPCVQFSKNASKAPHVNCWSIRNPKNYFGSPIKSRLNICVNSFILKAATSKVNHLYLRQAHTLIPDFSGFLRRIFSGFKSQWTTSCLRRYRRQWRIWMANLLISPRENPLKLLFLRNSYRLMLNNSKVIHWKNKMT